MDFYQIEDPYRLFGVEYDITANIPRGASPEDFLLMIQRLLAERADLEVHMDRKEQTVLELTIAKGGIKIAPAEPVSEGASGPSRAVTVDSSGVPHLPPGYSRAWDALTPAGRVYAGRSRTIKELIAILETPISRLIVDHTGLTGKYDYYFHCTRDEINPADGVMAVGECLKSILPDQLGLKLQPLKTMVDVFVVDHFNKQPSEN